MKKVKKIIINIARLLCWSQIILGFLWMCVNWNRVPDFTMTRELVDISKTGVLDEYTGFLYPVLIWLFRWIEKGISIPYYWFLYLIQIGLAIITSYYLIWALKFKDRVTMTLFLVSIPVCMQSHLSVLPYSILLSVWMVLLGNCIRLYRDYKDNTQKIYKVCCEILGLWVISGWIMPDYFWFGLPIVVWTAILVIKRNRRMWLWVLAAIALSSALLLGMNTLTEVAQSRGKIQKSFQAAMLERFVWPNFGTNSYFWPSEIWNVMDEATLSQVSEYPENVLYVFGPLIDQTYGNDFANDLYMRMAMLTWRIRTKEIAIDIGQDLTAYMIPHISLQLQLEGFGVTQNGWNYNLMKGIYPTLTRIYLFFSLFSFDILVLLGIWGCLRKWKMQSILLLLPGIFMSVWYTMSGAGVQDYKKCLLMWVLWTVIIMLGVYDEQKEVII